jgi:hypothetical protein
LTWLKLFHFSFFSSILNACNYINYWVMWINILNWLCYVIKIIITMCGIWMIHRFIFMWQYYLSQVKMMVRWSRRWEFQFPMTLTYMIIIKLDTCDLCDYSGFKLVTLNMAYMTYIFFGIYNETCHVNYICHGQSDKFDLIMESCNHMCHIWL